MQHYLLQKKTRIDFLTPFGGRGCIKGQILACIVLSASFPLILNCNMATFRKEQNDLLNPPGGQGCVKGQTIY